MLSIQVIADVWNRHLMTMRTIEHLHMFSIALFLSIIIGVLVGVFIYMKPKTANPVLNFLNIVETIPDLALIVLLLPILKLGAGPTIAACVLYSILPIARNTYTGLKNVDDQYTYVAQAIGLSPREALLKVRIPMSLPLIAGGIRIALVFCMGVVTLGGLVAAGGLGTVLQNGIQLYQKDAILVAGLWTGLLAVLLDGFAGLIEKKLHERYGTW
ncbi:MAG: osmoprotectant transport system permease protein [Methanolobus sp.]|jgi:osmoprotectant transport system permease protein|nr:osmoprotectant transport system permease protein [Methanolobus sp.]MDK2939458.1 osmoprotectant transport system permease protein [Methanolobus sp.]